MFALEHNRYYVITATKNKDLLTSLTKKHNRYYVPGLLYQTYKLQQKIIKIQWLNCYASEHQTVVNSRQTMQNENLFLGKNVGLSFKLEHKIKLYYVPVSSKPEKMGDAIEF